MGFVQMSDSKRLQERLLADSETIEQLGKSGGLPEFQPEKDQATYADFGKMGFLLSILGILQKGPA